MRYLSVRRRGDKLRLAQGGLSGRQLNSLGSNPSRCCLGLELLEVRELLAATVVHRVDAGGPGLGVGGWLGDTAAVPAVFSNVSASGSKAFSVTSAIDTSHPSLPLGTPAALFQSERFDPASLSEMSWDFPVTAGNYEVRLYFAEIFSGAQKVGGRVFDVSIEGAELLNDYDIFADVGGNRGVMKKFTVTADSNLDVDFARVVENPKISAIEILKLSDPNPPPTVVHRVDAGGPGLGVGGWLGDTAAVPAVFSNVSASGSKAFSVTSAIDTSHPSLPLGTPAALFQSERFDPASLSEMSWDFPVTAGNYEVRLYFAEIFSGAQKVGGRVFDVSIEGAVLLNDYDIFADVGGNRGVMKKFTVTADSNLDVDFARVVENPKISAIEILSLGGGGPRPVGFGKSSLSGTISARPTSLQFGPDGRLYVAQEDGAIQAYTLSRLGANNYQVTATETISLVKNLPNRDDDGRLNPTVMGRLITGLLVTGTATQPVIYTVSSDPRIGAGESGADLNLDTNSGVLSRLTRNGNQWSKLDLVRGLPRSEENHMTNGLALDATSNTLYMAQGGNTNMGAPSNNFAYLPEYALAAAILSVDLDAIGEATYDLPTLDDETRTGLADVYDPFGGNDGKNQAKLVPNGPVQVYAPGFRNPYDLVLTQAGRLYTIDNGPNAGWGSFPKNEGPAGVATNEPSEPGVSYGDGLHFITNAGYYGGHPNPTRSNMANTFNTSNPQSPVSVGNAVESDYRVPGSENGALLVFPQSTNGMVEYTASNFAGALQGDLLAASFDNSIKRVKLNAPGDGVVLSTNLFSSVGTIPLDVTAVGDDGNFPGTIWVADFLAKQIFVFEPDDFDGGSGGGGSFDDWDGDGYTNADETANGTDPNNSGDRPADWDQDFLSDFLDTDDDNDTWLDVSDPFAVDALNGKQTPLGTRYTWENDDGNPGGLLRMGFTGMMSNGVSDYRTLFDPNKVTAGGAAGVFTLDQVLAGTAQGPNNSQQQAFQFGVATANATEPFSAHTRLLAPFSGVTPQGKQQMGLFIGTGDQDNFIQIVLHANNGNPVIQVGSEVAGNFVWGDASPFASAGPSYFDLYLTIDPIAKTVQPNYSITKDGKTSLRMLAGAPISIPGAWLDDVDQGLAVGIISTTEGTAPGFSATWDFLSVVEEIAPVLTSMEDVFLLGGATRDLELQATDSDGSSIDFSFVGLPSFASFIDQGNGRGILRLTPTDNQIGTYSLTVTAMDNVSGRLSDSETFTVSVLAPAEVIYRVNAGGAAVFGSPAWAGDTSTAPAAYSNAGGAFSMTWSSSTAVDIASPTIPAGTPASVFQTHRFDRLWGQEMSWDFPVTPGRYLVRLYFAENYFVINGTGKRVFDVRLEGQEVLNDYDIFKEVGGNTGVVRSFLVEADSVLDLDFQRVIENPCVNAIEILSLTSTATRSLKISGSTHQNTMNRFDVNADGSLSPVDALVVVNAMASHGIGPLSSSERMAIGYVDVDGSGSLEPIDVLHVINALNRQSVVEGLEPSLDLDSLDGGRWTEDEVTREPRGSGGLAWSVSDHRPIMAGEDRAQVDPLPVSGIVRSGAPLASDLSNPDELSSEPESERGYEEILDDSTLHYVLQSVLVDKVFVQGLWDRDADEIG